MDCTENIELIGCLYLAIFKADITLHFGAVYMQDLDSLRSRWLSNIGRSEAIGAHKSGVCTSRKGNILAPPTFPTSARPILFKRPRNYAGYTLKTIITERLQMSNVLSEHLVDVLASQITFNSTNYILKGHHSYIFLECRRPFLK